MERTQRAKNHSPFVSFQRADSPSSLLSFSNRHCECPQENAFLVASTRYDSFHQRSITLANTSPRSLNPTNHTQLTLLATLDEPRRTSSVPPKNQARGDERRLLVRSPCRLSVHSVVDAKGALHHTPSKQDSQRDTRCLHRNQTGVQRHGQARSGGSRRRSRGVERRLLFSEGNASVITFSCRLSFRISRRRRSACCHLHDARTTITFIEWTSTAICFLRSQSRGSTLLDSWLIRSTARLQHRQLVFDDLRDARMTSLSPRGRRTSSGGRAWVGRAALHITRLSHAHRSARRSTRARSHRWTRWGSLASTASRRRR